MQVLPQGFPLTHRFCASEVAGSKRIKATMSRRKRFIEDRFGYGRGSSNHSATPPCPEHAPRFAFAFDSVPSVQRAVAIHAATPPWPEQVPWRVLLSEKDPS